MIIGQFPLLAVGITSLFKRGGVSFFDTTLYADVIGQSFIFEAPSPPPPAPRPFLYIHSCKRCIALLPWRGVGGERGVSSVKRSVFYRKSLYKIC